MCLDLALYFSFSFFFPLLCNIFVHSNSFYVLPVFTPIVLSFGPHSYDISLQPNRSLKQTTANFASKYPVGWSLGVVVMGETDKREAMSSNLCAEKNVDGLFQTLFFMIKKAFSHIKQVFNFELKPNNGPSYSDTTHCLNLALSLSLANQP